MTNMLMWVTLALLSGPADSQIEQIDSQYTRLDDCRRIKSGRGGEDWILVRCRGYGDIRIWSIVTDSTRARLGFGRNLNLSGTFEPAVPDDRRMVEWRGITSRGKFKPFAVISGPAGRGKLQAS